jgi:hypothetical protein
MFWGTCPPERGNSTSCAPVGHSVEVDSGTDVADLVEQLGAAEVGRRYIARLAASVSPADEGHGGDLVNDQALDDRTYQAIWLGEDEHGRPLPTDLRWEVTIAALHACADDDALLWSLGDGPFDHMLNVAELRRRLDAERPALRSDATIPPKRGCHQRMVVRRRLGIASAPRTGAMGRTCLGILGWGPPVLWGRREARARITRITGRSVAGDEPEHDRCSGTVEVGVSARTGGLASPGAPCSGRGRRDGHRVSTPVGRARLGHLGIRWLPLRRWDALTRGRVRRHRRLGSSRPRVARRLRGCRNCICSRIDRIFGASASASDALRHRSAGPADPTGIWGRPRIPCVYGGCAELPSLACRTSSMTQSSTRSSCCPPESVSG